MKKIVFVAAMVLFALGTSVSAGPALQVTSISVLAGAADAAALPL